MSRINKIRQEPVVVDKCHESVLCRAYHILSYVRELLEIIEACYEKDSQEVHETTIEKIKEALER